MAICPSICRVPGIHSLSAGGCLLLISPIPTTNTVPPCRGFSCLRHGALLYQAIVGLLFLFGKLSAHGPQPIQCGGGNILNISSMSAIRGIPDPVNNNGIYTATKFAINGFTECMQKYLLKYGIRVTALCPGSTATSWWTRWTHSFGTDAMLPVETLADIAELIVTSPEKVLFKQLQVLPTVEIDNF